MVRSRLYGTCNLKPAGTPWAMTRVATPLPRELSFPSQAISSDRRRVNHSSEDSNASTAARHQIVLLCAHPSGEIAISTAE
jgi:hypothetical protein